MSETLVSTTRSALSQVELEQLRQALATRYPIAKDVLGSQLGAILRRNLTDPDIKSRFGGLKALVAHYFPTEISWKGRRGLDDLYDICFATENSGLGETVWQRVSLEPSTFLWSAVTNPAIYIQFAWSNDEKVLFRASIGLPIPGDLARIEKLAKADYQRIAGEFIASLSDVEPGIRVHALETSGSSAEFTKLMREMGLLATWEAFRIDRACIEFANRLARSGAEPSIAGEWAETLRASQRLVWAERPKKSPTSATMRTPQFVVGRRSVKTQAPAPRLLATRAIEFLSDTELSALNLPFGAIMRALEALSGRL